MSVEIMTQAWKTSCPNCTSKLVLIALADNSNDQRVCWPSIDYIAKKCDLSINAVSSQIKKLELMGLIEVDRSIGRTSNRYTILPNQPPTACRVQLKPTPHGVDQPPTALDLTPHDVGTNHKEPSKEPSVSTETRGKRMFQKPSIEEFKAFCCEIEIPNDTEAMFWKWEGNGWLNGGKPIRDWKATLRSWKASGYLPSQKQTNGNGFNQKQKVQPDYNRTEF
jgi:Helix-turn-helix domain